MKEKEIQPPSQWRRVRLQRPSAPTVQRLVVYCDPVLGTTYGLKNITNKESEYLVFPNLKP